MAVKKIWQAHRGGCIAVLCIGGSVMILFGIYLDFHTFTPGNWAAHPDRRKLMVSSLVSQYELVGMTESEVVDLLGPERGRECGQSSFKGVLTRYDPATTLVYYIGEDLCDGIWMILPLENGVVTDVVYGFT